MTVYRTRDIAARCGIGMTDAAAIIRAAYQAQMHLDHIWMHGNAWEIDQEAYDGLFGRLESAYRDLKQAEADARSDELMRRIAKREKQIRSRIVTAQTGRPASEQRMGMRSRRPYKFRHRDGAAIRLFGPYREQVWP